MNETTAETGLRGVDVAGPPDAQPIVFVHGSVFTRKMWAPQRRALSEEFRIAAPDLPGHGARADGPFEFGPAVELLDETVETTADGNALVVGLSLGGYVATEYARRHPDKVDGLVISGSSANPVDGMELVTRVVGGTARLATRSDLVERGVRRYAERWVRKRDLPPDVAEEIIGSGFYPREFGNAGPYLAGRDFRSAFAAYPGPSLVLNGERDLVMRRGEEDHAAAARDARVEVIDGVGHVCNLHRPRAYTAAVRNFGRQAVATRG
ncbi:alpha/beta fold hydrolase [Halegenticoccus soli]|uniref:alpha/beta fold hydrolase n=1 Tax=Halegenticoccus soli TaxID=1985678 RepID=UPI000C6E117B|nr:alpha/beta hydrolase [Halegenticoccus soli]